MSKYKFDKDKLRDAVRAIIDQCEPHELGQVKLHKALYYADMLSYLSEGRPITGSPYKKRPFGPTNECLLHLLEDMSRDGEIEISEVNYFGYPKKEFRKRALSNASNLEERELNAIREVVNFVCKKHSASTISDFSHDIVWESVEMGQDIPYHLALTWIPVEYSEDTLEWAEEAQEELASKRRQAEKVESNPRGTLRERMASRS